MNTFLIQVNTQTDTAEISAPQPGSGDAPETSLPFGTLLDQVLQSAPQSVVSQSTVSQSAVSPSKTASTGDSPNLAEEAPLAEGQIAEGLTVTGHTIDPVSLVLSSLVSLSRSSLVAPPAEAPAAVNNGQTIHADVSLFPAHRTPISSLGGDISPTEESSGESGGTQQKFGHAFSSLGNGSTFTAGADGASASLVPVASQKNASLQLPAQFQAQFQTRLQTPLQTGLTPTATAEFLPAVDPAAASQSETSTHTATPTGTAIPAEADSATAEASRAQMATAITEFTAQDGARWERSFGSTSELGDKPAHETISPTIGKTAGQSPAAPVHLDSPLRPPQSAVGHRDPFPATEGLLTQNRAASPENSEIPATEVSAEENVEENPDGSLERGTAQKPSVPAQETTASFRPASSDTANFLHHRSDGSTLANRPAVRSTEGLPTLPPAEQAVTPAIAEAPKAPAVDPAAVNLVFSHKSAEAPQQGLENLRTDDLGPQVRIKPNAQAHDAPADSSDSQDHPGQEFSDHDPAHHELSNKGRAQVEEFVVPGTGVLFRGRELASMVSAEHAQVGAHFSGEQNSGPTTPRAMSQAPARTEGQLPTAQAAGENSRAQAPGVVNSARLLERLGETEMQVAFRSEALGSVNLRAVARENTIEAALGVERADVRAHLMSELPTLEQALAERNLKVQNITISHGSTGGGTALSSGSDSYARAFAQPQQPLPYRSGTDEAEHDLAILESGMTQETPGLGDGSTRLNLHV